MLTYGRKIIKLILIKSWGGVIKYVNVERKLFYKYCLFAILTKGTIR